MNEDRDRGRVYSVLEINRLVRGALERNFAAICIVAEVSGLKRSAAGHIYFDLVDPGGAAKIAAVMWKGVSLRYGDTLKNGLGVRVNGQLTVYEKSGNYQFVVSSAHDAGVGARAEALRQLALRLEAEGLFDPARKRKLPAMPGCVGVVTSRQGAALQDIIKVASRRFPVRLLIAHASVQGAAAPGEIAAGIERLGASAGVEVIIVGRGGGANDDLDAFNDESVVRAVASCPVPVISAVGHEVDITLCDRAADRRAATPSEAAELAVPEKEGLVRRLNALEERLTRSMRHSIIRQRQQLVISGTRLQTNDPRMRLSQQQAAFERCRQRLMQWSERTVASRAGRLQLFETRLRTWPGPAIARTGGQLATAADRLLRHAPTLVETQRHRLANLSVALGALSPLAAIGRGYSVVSTPDGCVVRNAADVHAGDPLHIHLASGRLEATVTGVHKEPSK